VNEWVLVTRDAEQARELADELHSRGVRVVPYPTLREVPVDDPEGWERAAAVLDSVEWLVLTSPRAAHALAQQAGARELAARLARVPTAAVGPGTARAARAEGFDVRLVGAAGGAELGRLLVERLVDGSSVLHPCGREHRTELGEVLAAAGARVVELVVYATEVTPPEELPPLPEEPPVAVVLSSPRAARGYFAACGVRYRGLPHLAFGAATAEECVHNGVEALTLAEPTPASIVEELCPTS
jgi:uroporphyrinogen-III synthase